MATATPTPTPTSTAPAAVDPTTVPVPPEVTQFHADLLHRVDSAVGLFVFVCVLVIAFLAIMTVKAMR